MANATIDNFSPMFRGDTSPPLKPIFQDGFGTIISLSGLVGSNFTLQMKNLDTKTVTTGAGTWTLLDAPNGKAQYQWVAADTAVAGYYSLTAVVQFSAGPQTFAFQTELQIKTP